MQNKPNGLKLLTEKRKSGWLKLLAAVFVCILPVIILWGIFKVNNNKLADFHLINSDEFDYYAETVSIARNGLINHASGYFGYSLDKHAKVLNYGAHAPFNLLPLALAAKLTGSSQATVLLANLVSLCVSLLIFYVLRRSLRDLALIFLLLFSFLPFILNFFTGMLEVQMFAGVILLLPLYAAMLEKRADSVAFKAYFLLVLVWTLFRITNIFLLLPVLIFEIITLKRKALSVLLKYAAILLGMTAVLWLLSASFPWSFIGQLLRSSTKIEFFFRHGLSMSLKFLLPNFGEPMEVVLRYAFLVWTGVLFLFLIKNRKDVTESERTFMMGHLAILVAHLVFVLFFYDFDEIRGFRMLAPILFFSLASFMLQKHGAQFKRLASIYVAFAWFLLLLVVFPIRQSLYQETVLRRLEPVNKSQVFKRAEYKPNPVDRWENTVYVDLFIYPDLDYAYFSPGLGLMVFRVDELDDFLAVSSPEELKARYLISSAAIEFPGYEKVCTDRDISIYQKNTP
jgi:hypothetical protein